MCRPYLTAPQLNEKNAFIVSPIIIYVFCVISISCFTFTLFHSIFVLNTGTWWQHYTDKIITYNNISVTRIVSYIFGRPWFYHNVMNCYNDYIKYNLAKYYLFLSNRTLKISQCILLTYSKLRHHYIFYKNDNWSEILLRN